MIQIFPKNEVFFRIECSSEEKKALKNYFSFYVPNFQFMPKYKKKDMYGRRIWDGKVSLCKEFFGNFYLYKSIYSQILEFCKINGYEISVHPSCYNTEKRITQEDVEDYIDSTPLSSNNQEITIRPYQKDTIISCLTKKRATIVSATSSGKSLSIYVIVKFLSEMNKKILLVVPTISLVRQMYADFKDYSTENGWSVESNCYMIAEGAEKKNNTPVTICTYQSINAFKDKGEKSNFLKSFDVLIQDEVHLAKATTLVDIAEKCVNASYRFGFTGTLQEAKAEKMVILSLYGPEVVIKTAKAMIEEGFASKVEIECILLKYKEEDVKSLKTKISKLSKDDSKYASEIDWIISNSKRSIFLTNFLRNLQETQENTLVLFTKIEHGKMIVENLKNNGIDAYYIDGGVKGKDRETIRVDLNEEKGKILVASYATVSTGINVPNLHNLIFASPVKSFIRVAQSIGRVLRLHKSKEIAKVYDLVDDLSIQKKSTRDYNYALKHFKERIEIYREAEFDFHIKEQELGQ